MRNFYFKKVLVAVLAMMAAMPSFAIDYWTVGKVQAVLKGGEETSAAGYVFVSPESVDAPAIAGVTSTMQTDPIVLSGNSGSSAVNKEYYFYAKPNDGYKFVGFAATSTGTPSGSGVAEGLAMVGDYYSYTAKAGAGYDSNTEEKPKVLVRYAVFEKIGGSEGEGGGEGQGGDDDTATEAKVVSVTNQFGKNLIDGVLTINDGGNFEDGDMVTHIYITFDHELKEITSMAAHKALAQAVTIVNTTTKETLQFNQYSCGVKSNDKYTLDMMLSTECYINNKDYAGVYVVTMAAGAATTTNDLPTEAYSFTFTYGKGEGHEDEKVNLDDYLGNWKQVVDEDASITNYGAFSFEKINDKYYMTNLYATSLVIPLVEKNGKLYFANTKDDVYSFEAAEGDAVQAAFQEQNGVKKIFLDQFTVKSVNSDEILGGICYFDYTNESIPTAIVDVKVQNDVNEIYDLQGRRLSSLMKGINIVNGKKYVVK